MIVIVWKRCAREGCPNQFKESTHNKKFCSKRCRNRVMSQRYRERYNEMKEAKKEVA